MHGRSCLSMDPRGDSTVSLRPALWFRAGAASLYLVDVVGNVVEDSVVPFGETTNIFGEGKHPPVRPSSYSSIQK